MRPTSYIILLGSQAAFVTILAGCPKNEVGAVDGGAGSASAVPVASQVTLAPLGDTATAATSVAPSTTTVAPLGTSLATTTALKPTASGAIPSATAVTPSNSTTQAQLKQCCAALRKQAQAQPAQTAQLAQAAGVCDGLVAAMGTAPSVPQLDQVKMLLAGVSIPPVCQGL